MKVLIVMADDLVMELDRIAKEEFTNRSDLIRRVLTDYLKREGRLPKLPSVDGRQTA